MKSDTQAANEVRKRLVERRIAQVKRRLVMLSLLCLCLPAGLWLALQGEKPSVLPRPAALGNMTSAYGADAGGYVLVGIICFVLGIAVAAICIKKGGKK